MKKIRILALLVIVVFVAEVIMSNGTADFRRGWNSAGNSRELKFSTVDISIKAEKNIAVDSLFNSVIQQNVPCRMSSLETEIQPSFINKLILMLAFPLVLFALYEPWEGIHTRKCKPHASFCLFDNTPRHLYGDLRISSAQGCCIPDSV